jgi:hypothetical protein
MGNSYLILNPNARDIIPYQQFPTQFVFVDGRTFTKHISPNDMLTIQPWDIFIDICRDGDVSQLIIIVPYLPRAHITSKDYLRRIDRLLVRQKKNREGGM